MDKIIMAIATGLGLGYAPKAPGTFGTLLALPLHFLLIKLSLPYYSAALTAIFLLAVFTAGSAEKILDYSDPGAVVIDEIIGMLITLIGAPTNLLVWIIGFALFRFFDILKPFPINFIDQRLHGGLGIVLDDIMAGIYSLICLQLICYLWF
ncbi:MAG: phosphatidylglycerophosphatase A [Proteobacteria bacterium]|nr:phosphatidylglycerophosphatase A [Pseudomonadota bacterium]MBU1715716.1 phosphatidylglycerophosphatase A [Pseudomonadota bacterium]